MGRRISAIAVALCLSATMIVALVPGTAGAAEQEIQIEMSDGVVVVGDLLTPEEGERFPVLLNMTPYGPATYFDTYRARATRTSTSTSGEPVAPAGNCACSATREQKDVYEVVEWIADQEWSNGNVGMYGGSYQGITPLMGAAEQPPHLKAIVPAVVLADAYRDIVWHNGVFNANFVAQWTALQFGLGVTGAWPTAMSPRALNNVLLPSRA